jgi:NAD(P)-dependent dehydrogenase (short-subunit alcohol dehydrogenase family)
MGFETARLLIDCGASVIGIDRVAPELPVARFLQTDLSSADSIAATADAIEDVHALFNVAGISSGAADPVTVVTVNFIGPRALTEALLPKFHGEGAVASVASISAFRYAEHLDTTGQLVDTPDFEAAVEWCRSNPELLTGGGYQVAKEAVVIYSLRNAIAYGTKGLRFNVIGPGATETPFLRDTVKGRGQGAIDRIPKPLGRLAHPSEQAGALLFLNSPVASYVNAHLLWVDGGMAGGIAVGAVESDR